MRVGVRVGPFWVSQRVGRTAARRTPRQQQVRAMVIIAVAVALIIIGFAS